MASKSFHSSILHINTLYNSLLAIISLYTAFFWKKIKKNNPFRKQPLLVKIVLMLGYSEFRLP